MQQNIDSFNHLAEYILSRPDSLKEVVAEAGLRNQWFTEENVWNALDAIARNFLSKDLLQQWLAAYPAGSGSSKKVGIIAAGNVPLVSFHDILCTLLAGHHAVVKLSDKDKVLIPFLLEKLSETDRSWQYRFSFEDRFQNVDAVIATGGTNTSRYFEFYFGKYPHIIRKNRHSAAVIKGNESEEDLMRLGLDVFQYFGLGCRNVSLLWLPAGYDVMIFREVWREHHPLMQHHGYRNNLDYHRTIYLMNGVPLADIDFVNIVESKEISSPIATLHVAYYDSLDEVDDWMQQQHDKIQCMVNHPYAGKAIPFGQTQYPGLNDYADGEDTMSFLTGL